MSRKQLLTLAYALIAAVLLAAVLYAAVLFASRTTEMGEKEEKYDELEFVMVHRPHVTYFVDFKYMLCFATLKPAYRDLTEFRCPEYLLKQAAGDFSEDERPKKSEKSGGNNE